MDNKYIKSSINKIEVPKEDVFNAIDEGIKRESQTKTKKPNKKKLIISCVAAASIGGITFLSGFFIPSMNQVLASAPFIGRIYEEFGDNLGVELAKDELVTELDEEITQNGVTVKLKNAYFDGDNVSIIGHISGNIGKGELHFDVNFENNKGDKEDSWLNNMSTGIHESEDGYDFQWKLKYPYGEIKEDFTLPVSIHNINGIKGNWSFDVPIKQDINKTLMVNKSKFYKDEEIKIKIDEINIARETSNMIFETVSKYKNDYIDIYKAEDGNGNKLFNYKNNTKLSTLVKEDNHYNIYRKNINKIDKDIKSIKLYPSLSIYETPVQETLNKRSFILESKRTDFEIKVNNVTEEGNKLIVDYNFKGLKENLSKDKIDILAHNLSYSFSLVDKDFINDIDPENPFLPKGHSISRNNVKLIDKDNYHFQSVFELDGEEKIEDFSLENTILRFDFTSFIENKKLEPFIIDLVE